MLFTGSISIGLTDDATEESLLWSLYNSCFTTVVHEGQGQAPSTANAFVTAVASIGTNDTELAPY